MKFLKSILIFSFAIISQFAFCQDFVSKEEALKKIEIQQANYQDQFENNIITKIKIDISDRYLDVVKLYLKDGMEIEPSLNAALEKCLYTFKEFDEEVVEFNEEIIALLTVN